MTSAKCLDQKVILLGDYGVGKTSLFRRFAFDTFVESTDRKSTMGLDFYDRIFKTQDGTNFKFQLWDTCGLERVTSLTSSYYKWSEAVILVFAANDPQSFHSLAQHLLEITNHAHTAKVFLCTNKIDLCDSEQLENVQKDIQTFCDECGECVRDVYLTSCKTNTGVEQMFDSIVNHLSTLNVSKMHLSQLNEEIISLRLKSSEEEEQSGSCC